jgi:16S rRNA (guanine527-N7)-methyltransferase
MKGAKTDPPELGRLLRNAAAEVGVDLSEAQVARFLSFLQELQVWSAKVSLTAIREPQAIILKHFVDSLTALPYVRECASLLDVGSGPGLPGLALKIAAPSLRLVSVESRRRKVSFQEHLVRTLKLEGVEVIWGRLERGCGLVPEASVACAVSRALSLEDFLTYAAPFVAPGGRLVAMQGRRPTQEPVVPPGLVLTERVSLRLPVLGEERTLVIFEKPRA